VKRALVVAALLMLVSAAPATAAPEPVDVVHSETVRLGTSTLTASFDYWPIPSNRSMDFLFEPADGIEGRTGLLRVLAPSGEVGIRGIGLEKRGDDIVLPRHPRDRDRWGMDVVALPEEGTWRFEFTVDGPGGRSTGVLPLEVGPAPGPPMALSWTVAMLPWAAAVLALVVFGWIRVRRGRAQPAWSG
jgi:hypothetical protein